MNVQKLHVSHWAQSVDWMRPKKVPSRLSMSLALSVALILCWCSKKEESVSSAPIAESTQNITDREKYIDSALGIIDNYLGGRRLEIPEYTAQQQIFINNIIQLLWAYEWDELVEQARGIYNNQKQNNKPVPFPFDPNWCKNAEDFVQESRQYLSTLSVYLTWQGISRGIYEYDISHKNLLCVGKPIKKIVISDEENLFEWRVIPHDGVILLNLQALATSVFINGKIWLPPEAMIRWVIANELWNCEFYTDYDVSWVSKEDAFRLSEAYSTLKTLKSYETSTTVGGMLILSECINSHFSAIIWFDAWVWVDYDITHSCVLRAHKQIFSQYAQEHPDIAIIFETNDGTIRERIQWVQRKISKNPGQYDNLGKNFLKNYEQAFRDACREKWARIKE